MKEDNLKCEHYPLARVVAKHLGEDKIMQVVTVRILRGTYKRPIDKI